MAQRRLVGLPEVRPSDDTVTAVRDLRDALNRHPFIVRDGVLFHGALGAGNNVISHGLGRTPKGWLVTRNVGGQATLYEVANSVNDRTITLNSVANTTADIWFF